MKSLQEQLDAIRNNAKLHARGWDGYNALPLELETINAAQRFIEGWSAVPTMQGGIQLEVHTHGIDFEIEFKPNRKSTVFLEAHHEEPE
jgi:hypothetical protein